jgi:hypothetical protein
MQMRGAELSPMAWAAGRVYGSLPNMPESTAGTLAVMFEVDPGFWTAI